MRSKSEDDIGNIHHEYHNYFNNNKNKIDICTPSYFDYPNYNHSLNDIFHMMISYNYDYNNEDYITIDYNYTNKDYYE